MCSGATTQSPTCSCREADILQDLPPQLHAEVKALANVEVIKLLRQIDLFADLDDVILNKLIVSLRTQFLPPGECVCMEGELGRHLYIIRKGICKVCITSQCAVCAPLQNCLRPASVKVA